MALTKDPRVAWLFPSLERGYYWHPIFSRFSSVFKQTIVYSGYWTGYAPGYENSFTVEVVGQTRYVRDEAAAEGYNCKFIYASPAIVGYLIRFRPDIIFTSGFSIWTALALLLKFVFRWRVVVLYDGNSPGIDHRSSQLRFWLRRLMAWFVDAYAANNQDAKTYLSQYVGASDRQVFCRPYLVPQASSLQKQQAEVELAAAKRPVFLYVGDLIPRKGLPALLEACRILQQQGVQDYSLLVVGNGTQRAELEEFVETHRLSDRVIWAGWVEYGQLGAYFRHANVFVFPTLEDIWGMVTLEAMVFGKPVLCSKWAGSCELVIDGENGYRFDPHSPDELATLMRCLIESPDLIAQMGQRSEAIIARYTPEAATQLFVDITNTVLKRAQPIRDELVRAE